MPGPFPGMDPYLESPEFWRDFHSSMLPAIRGQLTTILPPGFAAFIEERIYIISPQEQFIPDIVITRWANPPASQPGGTAVLDRIADGSETVTFFPDRMHELYIEVRRVGSRGRAVVAAIELLSPSNKQRRGKGHDEYRNKQRALLESESHLLEIDLLRGGAHTLAAPRQTFLANGPWDYLVSLHRAGQGNTFEIWRNLLTNRLPRIKVPLADNHPDAILDLQEALDAVYDAAPYRHVIDYHQEPDPPLSEENRKWVDSLLRERGFRT